MFKLSPAQKEALAKTAKDFWGIFMEVFKMVFLVVVIAAIVAVAIIKVGILAVPFVTLFAVIAINLYYNYKQNLREINARNNKSHEILMDAFSQDYFR